MAATPRGNSNGATQQSHFGNFESGVPPWATSGSVDNYWQDSSSHLSAYGLGTYGTGSLSGSSKAGFLGNQASLNHWNYDNADPLYSNREIFDIDNNISNIPRSYSFTTSTSCDYPNRNSARDTRRTVNTGTYYPSSKLIYENTPTVAGAYFGRYNFTVDGNKNGSVDSGWAWASNRQRVQYAETYKGHERKLGVRILADPAAAVAIDCTSALANPDTYFLGESAAKCLLPGRDSATIYNPSIGVNGAADVFGTAGIDGYFSGNSAPSAFLFSNGVITSAFNSPTKFSGYYNNPAKRANAFYDPTSAAAAIKAVFGNYFTAAASKSIGNNISGAFDLGQDASRLYKPAVGDMTIGATSFRGGQGTIYVQGNLHITGNLQYANSASPTDKKQLPSVGFVVTGNVIVDPGVTSIVGTYFAGGSFNTRSVLNSYLDLNDKAGSYNYDRANSDAAFTLNGVMIALDFSLQRQPSGAALQAGVIPETFTYDGRVIVNPPQGFTDIQKYPAAWNESVPYN